MTWMMLLWLGVTTPIEIEGYKNLAECEIAGRNAVVTVKRCLLDQVKCAYDCIPGPSE